MKLFIFILTLFSSNSFFCCFTDVRNTLESSLNRTRKSTTTTKSSEIPLDRLGCGVSYFKPSLNRIVYADKAIPFSWPWTVAIIYKFPETGWQFACAATLIRSNYLITSANCVPSENIYDYKLLIGINELNATLEPNNINYVLNITKHPEHKDLTNDIAIIKLSQKVNITQKTLFICLPEDRDKSVVYDKNVIVVGWGSINGKNDKNSYSNTLMQATLKVLNRNTDWSRCYGPDFTNYCAKDVSETKPSNICFGDSGGPMMFFKDGKYYLYGITSYMFYNSNGCVPEEPSYYTQIPNYLDWILDTIGS